MELEKAENPILRERNSQMSFILGFLTWEEEYSLWPILDQTLMAVNCKNIKT